MKDLLLPDGGTVLQLSFKCVNSFLKELLRGLCACGSKNNKNENMRTFKIPDVSERKRE